MPWNHCDKEVLDDQSCPVCGTSKEQWTLNWDSTREFKVQKKASKGLKLILHDADDKPIPKAAYVVKLPDGTQLKGNLDKNGYAKIDTRGAKTVKVAFPELPADAWKSTPK